MGVGGRFKREETCVSLQLTHAVVQQKQTQYCKAIILQWKINYKNKNLSQSSKIIYAYVHLCTHRHHLFLYKLLYFYLCPQPKHPLRSQSWVTDCPWIQHRDTIIPWWKPRLVGSAKLFLVCLWTGLWIPRGGTEIIKLISHHVLRRTQYHMKELSD